MKDNHKPFVLIITFLLSFQFSIGQPVEFDDSYRKHPLLVSADALLSLEDWDVTIEAYEKAKVFFEENENWPGYIYALSQIGYCYRRARIFNEAIRYLRLALKEGRDRIGDEHPEISRAYHHLGYHFQFNPNRDMDSSGWARRKAVEIARKSLPDNHIDLAIRYHGLASHYLEEQVYLEAIENYKKAIDIKERILDPNDPELAVSYLYNGIAWRAIGDTYRSQNYLRAAITIYEANPGASRSRYNTAVNSLANTFFDVNDFELARPQYQKAIRLRTKQSGASSYRLITPMNNLGLCLVNLNQFDSAHYYLKKAIKLNSSFEEPDKDLLSDSYKQYGFLYLIQQKSDSAAYYFDNALKLRQEVFGLKSPFVSDLYLALSSVFLFQDDYDLSLEYHQRALIALELNFKNNSILVNPSIENTESPVRLFNILSSKANTFFLKYNQQKTPDDLTEAIRLYQLVDRLTDRIRNEAFSEDTKLQIASKFKANAASAMACLSEAYRVTRKPEYLDLIFKFIEKNRYAQIFSNLSKVQSIAQANLPDSLFYIESRLSEQIATQNQNLKEETDSAAIREIQSEIFKIERTYQQHQEFLASNYPAYYTVKYDDILSLAEMQDQLDHSSMVIEYFWGNSTITALSFNRSEVTLNTISLSQEITEALATYLNSMANYVPDLTASQDELFNSFAEMSNKLYQLLVDPMLFGSPTKIIISPDGTLSMLPFETLLTSIEAVNFKTAAYLVNQIDIQYIYSCNLLQKNPAPPPIGQPKVLAFGYSSDQKQLSDTERSDLSEIPESAWEVKAIKAIFGAGKNRYLTGDDATEAAFKQLAGDYEILHLAVHGIGDPQEALNSHLEFRSAGDTVNDGKIFAHELYTLRLDKLRLVVLSACESGIGKEQAGEGIFSMARGFAYAGSPSIVMSLWNVDDKATSRLMEFFYNFLSQGNSVSEAIRQAKLKYIKDSDDSRLANPYYWAAFVPLGDTKPVIKKNNYLIYLLLIIPVAIVIAARRKWRKKP